MKHYTVCYYDSQHHKQSICAYANDCYEARQVAIESVRFIHEHPNTINHILMEHYSKFVKDSIPIKDLYIKTALK